MIGLIASVVLAQAAAVPPDSIITAPNWVRKPSSERIAELYPAGARLLGHGGRATIECKVHADGTLGDCHVTEEAPTGEGFGEAALKMSSTFQMKPFTVDGRAVGGGIVRIPILFVPPTGQLDPLSGTLRCYGRAAASAEADPASQEAWLATRFWALQSLTAAAMAHRPPSAVEDELRASRVGAAETKDSLQVKYESEACARAMRDAMSKSK